MIGNAVKICIPRRPAAMARITRSARAMKIINGQMWRRRVTIFGSGSEVSFVLKIKYDLEKILRHLVEEFTWMLPRRGRAQTSREI